MGRLWNGLLYLLAGLAVLYSIVSKPGPDQARRPPPVEHPAKTRVVPRPVVPPQLPRIDVEIEQRQSAIGTAFAIADGWWMTARHVVDGCDKVGLVVKRRTATRVSAVFIHPHSDLALMTMNLSRPALPLVRRGGFARGQDGYASGYPQGRPGDVHARYLGNLRLRSTGRYRTDEVAAVWAETDRVPGDLPALGGLSGGPMLDRDGAVIGVLVASSARRGRVITVIPATIAAFVEAYDVPSAAVRQGPRLTGENFTGRGDELRRDLRIAQVVCQVAGSKRRPAPSGTRPH